MFDVHAPAAAVALLPAAQGRSDRRTIDGQTGREPLDDAGQLRPM